ncbi:MAG: NAD(P)/FAD-dependent oxidoreductase [Burkholderiaceae bacterium]|nr:NAD(P)/FAD-dependent oxidoreductase [Burkholderiaceae bacterium]
MPPSPAPIDTDAVVIGAGPAGLWQVFQLGLQGLSVHLVEALPSAGGQCVALYGDKPIYDLPGLPVCTGQELAQRLLAQIQPFAPTLHLGQLVSTLQAQDDGRWLLETPQGTRLRARCVFIAAGVGAFLPRALKVEGLEAFAGSQLHYHPDPGPSVQGQRVVVHGGDEDAVAHALALLASPDAAPAQLTLLHRRDVFAAAPALLEQLQAARAAGRLDVAIGQITGVQTQQNRLVALQLATPEGETRTLPLDQLHAFPGLSPRLGPLAEWGLALERKQLPVDPATFATQAPGLYAVGDIVSYPGKRKLIVCGFHEATLAALAAAEYLAGQKLPLEYTSSSTRLQQRLGVAPQPAGQTHAP